MSDDFGTPVSGFEEPKKKSNTTLIIIIVVVLVVLCCCCLIGAGFWYFWTYGDTLFNTYGVIARQLALIA
jgi:hypothetical protein